MDNDFPTVMANGGGKTFLSGFVKGMNKYSQAGTDVDDRKIKNNTSFDDRCRRQRFNL